MVLDIVEKAPQLAGLKKPITPENQNDSHRPTGGKHPPTGGKHPPSGGKHLPGHKLSATAKKARKEFLNDSGLTSEEIEGMDIA
jgi:hypothetical protein